MKWRWNPVRTSIAKFFTNGSVSTKEIQYTFRSNRSRFAFFFKKLGEILIIGGSIYFFENIVDPQIQHYSSIIKKSLFLSNRDHVIGNIHYKDEEESPIKREKLLQYIKEMIEESKNVLKLQRAVLLEKEMVGEIAEVIIMGPSGSGKTQLLQQYAQMVIEELNEKIERIPDFYLKTVYIFNADNQDILEQEFRTFATKLGIKHSDHENKELLLDLVSQELALRSDRSPWLIVFDKLRKSYLDDDGNELSAIDYLRKYYVPQSRFSSNEKMQGQVIYTSTFDQRTPSMKHAKYSHIQYIDMNKKELLLTNDEVIDLFDKVYGISAEKIPDQEKIRLGDALCRNPMSITKATCCIKLTNNLNSVDSYINRVYFEVENQIENFKSELSLTKNDYLASSNKNVNIISTIVNRISLEQISEREIDTLSFLIYLNPENIDPGLCLSLINFHYREDVNHQFETDTFADMLERFVEYHILEEHSNGIYKIHRSLKNTIIDIITRTQISKYVNLLKFGSAIDKSLNPKYVGEAEDPELSKILDLDSAKATFERTKLREIFDYFIHCFHHQHFQSKIEEYDDLIYHIPILCAHAQTHDLLQTISTYATVCSGIYWIRHGQPIQANIIFDESINFIKQLISNQATQISSIQEECRVLFKIDPNLLSIYAQALYYSGINLFKLTKVENGDESWVHLSQASNVYEYMKKMDCQIEEAFLPLEEFDLHIQCFGLLQHLSHQQTRTSLKKAHQGYLTLIKNYKKDDKELLQHYKDELGKVYFNMANNISRNSKQKEFYIIRALQLICSMEIDIKSLEDEILGKKTYSMNADKVLKNIKEKISNISITNNYNGLINVSTKKLNIIAQICTALKEYQLSLQLLDQSIEMEEMHFSEEFPLAKAHLFKALNFEQINDLVQAAIHIRKSVEILKNASPSHIDYLRAIETEKRIHDKISSIKRFKYLSKSNKSFDQYM